MADRHDILTPTPGDVVRIDRGEPVADERGGTVARKARSRELRWATRGRRVVTVTLTCGDQRIERTITLDPPAGQMDTLTVALTLRRGPDLLARMREDARDAADAREAPDAR